MSELDNESVLQYAVIQREPRLHYAVPESLWLAGASTTTEHSAALPAEAAMSFVKESSQNVTIIPICQVPVGKNQSDSFLREHHLTFAYS